MPTPCAMTSAQFAADRQIFRQRQNTASRMHHTIADDHGAVMQGGLVEKDIADQLSRRLGIDHRTGADDFPSFVVRSKTMRAPIFCR